MEGLISELTQFGIIGIILALVLYLYIRKDAELSKIQEDRVKDNKEVLEKFAVLSKELKETVERLIERDNFRKIN